MRTVQAAAATLNRPISTINYWCRTHQIGTLVTSRLRMLSDADLTQLHQIAATIQRGNRGPRDEAGKFRQTARTSRSRPARSSDAVQ